MAFKLPENNITTWLPRVLLLGVIWGFAVFLWSTFGAWTRTQYVTHELALAQAAGEATDNWLTQALAGLDRLANDKRIAMGMDLPAGVESLPVQRVLYEYTYLTGQNEVYVVDLVRKQVGHTAGAPELQPAVVDRLADMNLAERGVLGIGQRSGQMLLIRKVQAPLPYRLVVVVPTNLSVLSDGQPVVNLPPRHEMSLAVPHTTGWALWKPGDQGFRFSDALVDAMKHHRKRFVNNSWMTVLVPLAGWPEVAIGLQSPDAITGTRMLPQVLVGLWAIMMSLVVLWHGSPAYQKKLQAMAAPVLKPVSKVLGPVGGVLGSLKEALLAYRRNTVEEPLLAGAGAFDDDRGRSGAEMAMRMRTGIRRTKDVKPLKLGQKAPDKVARGKPPKPLPKPERMAAREHAMAWPKEAAKVALKPLEVVDGVDQNDMRAIVEDCLRKKRVKLLYQPIYRAGDNMPVMHEVFARLVRSDGEVISPDIFLPVASRHRMTLELDLLVLRKVVGEHFRTNSGPLTPLALNISSTSLDGIAYLQEMANQGPRVLQKMSFEVSSQEMIRDPKALRLLKELQKHGGNLAVDYFGGGIAMLEASRSMGFNYVKINSARFMETESGKKEITMLCQHARKIGLPIILERIENMAASDFGREIGAEFLQGYGLMRPQDHLNISPLTPNVAGMKNLAPTEL